MRIAIIVARTGYMALPVAIIVVIVKGTRGLGMVVGILQQGVFGHYGEKRTVGDAQLLQRARETRGKIAMGML